MKRPSIIEKIACWIATGFGLGYMPVASGTWGTLPGVVLVWFLYPHMGGVGQTALAAALAALAIPFCEVAERMFAKKDDGRIVADEYMTFPLCMIGLPVTPLMLLIAFGAARFFDIVKPPPARGLQRIHGGFGIVIDDVFASLYALVANHVIYWTFIKGAATGSP